MRQDTLMALIRTDIAERVDRHPQSRETFALDTTFGEIATMILAADIARESGGRPDEARSRVDAISHTSIPALLHGLTAMRGQQYCNDIALPTGGVMGMGGYNTFAVGSSASRAKRTKLVLVADHPGVHLEKTAPTSTGNLRRLHETIISDLKAMATPDAPYEDGDVAMDVDIHGRDVVELRVRGGPGLKVADTRYPGPVSRMTPEQIRIAADHVLSNQKASVPHRKAMDQAVVALRAAVEPIVGAAISKGIDVALDAVHYHSVFEDVANPARTHFSLQIMIGGLGPDLQPFVWELVARTRHAGWIEEAAKAAVGQMRVQKARQTKRANAAGAMPIERTALTVMNRCPEGADAIRRRLREGRKTESVLEDGKRATFSWRDGVVQVSLHLGGEVQWSYGTITVRESGIPDTIFSQIAGSPLGGIIRHDLLDPEATIRSYGGDAPARYVRLNIASRVDMIDG